MVIMDGKGRQLTSVPQVATEYEVVIGLEVHSQLLTESKMFCACSAAYQDAAPNTTVCAVCLGLPGALPVMNRKAVDYVIRTGLALGCDISGFTKFDRKNYPVSGPDEGLPDFSVRPTRCL